MNEHRLLPEGEYDIAEVTIELIDGTVILTRGTLSDGTPFLCDVSEQRYSLTVNELVDPLNGTLGRYRPAIPRYHLTVVDDPDTQDTDTPHVPDAEA